MIPLTIIWIFMTAGAIYLMTHKEWVIGNWIWYLGYILDFMMLAYLVTTYTAPGDNTFYTFSYGVFSIGLAVWILMKFFIPAMIQNRNKA